jgi:ribosome-associated toxin RatA of RatAB toxin-antitoxin module
MHSAVSIRIAAPPELVFALARDVERWADLLPHYSRSTAVARDPDGRLLMSFVARRPLIGVLGLGLPVAWRARTWNESAERRLWFRHTGGATRGMDVTWRIEPTDDCNGATVTIEHDFRPRLPGVARFIDRWFTRPIAGRTLATFRALAEAMATTDTGHRVIEAAPKSDSGCATKTRT